MFSASLATSSPASTTVVVPASSTGSSRRNTTFVTAVLTLFVLLATTLHRKAVGGDLATSYFGCQVVATHQASHLFRRDPTNYAAIDDPVWALLAQKQNYALKRLHPYVQVPLWAFALQPLCTHTSFNAFRSLLLLLANLCFAGTLWLIARHWTPRLFRPLPMAALCFVLLLSAPYNSAIALVQTHIFFVLLTLVALANARKRPVLAGLCLALATAVKITPGFFVLYWLVLWRWRAAGIFAAALAALLALDLLVSGPSLAHEYLASLKDISNMLLVSWDNQSLAAWWMQRRYPFAETQAWHALPLPQAVKLVSAVLTVLSVLLGAFLDRRQFLQRNEKNPRINDVAPVLRPFGAAFAMLGLTIFAAVAWDHYFVLLVFPLMVLLEAGLEPTSPTSPAHRSAWLFALVAAVCLLNVDLRNFVGLTHRLQAVGLVPPMRAQFFSGILCMAALVALSLFAPRRLQTLPSALHDQHRQT